MMPQAGFFLHTFFEEQVDVRPEADALVCIGKTYTYKELDIIANKVARYLRIKGITTGDMVGLYCNKSDLPIVAILGILKSGAGYVPLDPAYPEERIGHILKDAGVKVVVSEESLGNKSVLQNSTVVFLDKEIDRILLQSPEKLDPGEVRLDDSQLCYIIYTSGSTGRPKGVMTEHRNIVQFVKSFKKVCNMTPQDRVYQGFSFTFDGSVEEIWIAWANGATLVTANNEIASMPVDAAQYITSRNVTYFSTVPTFLSMIKDDLPTVKLLVVSGEACPQETVDKWALNGRRMLNVYGPTEATVNTTAAECRAGKKVTIGVPLEGYEIFILDEKMMPVTSGTQGELYIAGPTLSRGYMNLPEVTSKAFLPKPAHLNTMFDRIYKTGDLVSLNENNELYFYGRIDHQVKVRGYRIELCEIEAVLREYTAVQGSAVMAYENKQKGLTELAAYIVCKKGEKIQTGELVALLKKRLPQYMIPSYLEIINEIPTLTSGKTDRSRLPAPSTPLIDAERIIVEAATQTQKIIADIWKEQFKAASISIEDNFFTDLGGYSLVAANTVSLLRAALNCDINIRDIYSFPTITALSEHVELLKRKNTGQANENKKRRVNGDLSSTVFKRTPWLIKYGCMTLQAISLILLYSVPVAGVMGSVFLYQKFLEKVLSLPDMIIISSVVLVTLYPVILLSSILVKWVVIGKFKPGEYLLWGGYYFRWWLVTRIHRVSGASFLAGTPLMAIYLRLMGAKIGKGVIINTPHISCFDLLEIGHDSAVGFEAQLNGYRVENGLLKIGTIKIGKECFTGIQSSIGLNCTMKDNASLDDLSLLTDNDTMQQNESRYGSPSRKGIVRLPSKTTVKDKKPMNSFFFTLCSIGAVYFVEVFLLLSALPSGAALYFAFQKNDWTWWLSLLAISIVLFELTFWMFLIITKYVILFKAKPGTYHIQSIYYLRKWIIDTLLSLSRLLTLPVYTTLYALPLLRMLGVKIGKRAELSVLGYVSPDLVSVGQESFFADGSIVGGIRLYNGLFELTENRVGSRSFIGNSALVPVGCSVGNNCLIGVMSVPPAETTETPSNTEWLGSPSFQLPYRKKVEGFKEHEIFRPGLLTCCGRLVIDGMRIMIPSTIEIVNLIGMLYLTYYVMKHFSFVESLLFIPVIAVGLMVGVSLCVVMVKNALIGVYKPVIKPLWSPYVWINEAVNGTYESIIAPLLMPLLGTPFISVFLRLLGVKIGKHVFVETLLLGEFDLVEIGDYSALNFDVIVQNHLFEDRIFKSSYLKIGNDCSIGNMAVILYDTEMGDGSSIGPLSLLMKGEKIQPLSSWEGIPIA
jgi:non-ribosomal peptide synthetase-like protein